MITLEDGVLRVEGSMPDLVAELAYIYYTLLGVGETHGIPWGNTAKATRDNIQQVEEVFVVQKHSDIIDKLNKMVDDVTSPFTDDNE